MNALSGCIRLRQAANLSKMLIGGEKCILATVQINTKVPMNFNVHLISFLYFPHLLCNYHKYKAYLRIAHRHMVEFADIWYVPSFLPCPRFYCLFFPLAIFYYNMAFHSNGFFQIVLWRKLGWNDSPLIKKRHWIKHCIFVNNLLIYAVLNNLSVSFNSRVNRCRIFVAATGVISGLE